MSYRALPAGLVSIALAVGAAESAPAQCGEYRLVDLGTLGGTTSVANAISDRGWVVGQSQTGAGEFRAFLWRNGGLENLVPDAEISNSSANAVSRSGVVAGHVRNASGEDRAFRWSNGTLHVYGAFAGGTFSYAAGLNEDGVIVGMAAITNAFGMPPQPFVLVSNDLVNLGTFDGASSGQAYDINTDGRVVGFAHLYCPGDCWDPFIWVDANSNGVRNAGELQNLGTLGGLAGYAMAINEGGQVVGWAFRTGYSQRMAFRVTPVGGLWDSDNQYNQRTNLFMQALGTLGGSTSEAFAINDAGDIVGSADTPAGVRRAFLHRDGAMVDLNNLVCDLDDWVLTEAYGINNSGQIVGAGLRDGARRAFLLEPVTSAIDIVRFGVAASEPAGPRVLQWRSLGTGWVFTVEVSTSFPEVAWGPLSPTSQWPQAGTSWEDAGTSVPPAAVLRVVGSPWP